MMRTNIFSVSWVLAGTIILLLQDATSSNVHNQYTPLANHDHILVKDEHDDSITHRLQLHPLRNHNGLLIPLEGETGVQVERDGSHYNIDMGTQAYDGLNKPFEVTPGGWRVAVDVSDPKSPRIAGHIFSQIMEDASKGSSHHSIGIIHDENGGRHFVKQTGEEFTSQQIEGTSGVAGSVRLNSVAKGKEEDDSRERVARGIPQTSNHVECRIQIDVDMFLYNSLRPLICGEDNTDEVCDRNVARLVISQILQANAYFAENPQLNQAVDLRLVRLVLHPNTSYVGDDTLLGPLLADSILANYSAAAAAMAAGSPENICAYQLITQNGALGPVSGSAFVNSACSSTGNVAFSSGHAADLPQIVAHEFAHTLGFDHGEGLCDGHGFTPDRESFSECAQQAILSAINDTSSPVGECFTERVNPCDPLAVQARGAINLFSDMNSCCDNGNLKPNGTKCSAAVVGVCQEAALCDGLHAYCPNVIEIFSLPEGTVCGSDSFAGTCDGTVCERFSDELCLDFPTPTESGCVPGPGIECAVGCRSPISPVCELYEGKVAPRHAPCVKWGTSQKGICDGLTPTCHLELPPIPQEGDVCLYSNTTGNEEYGVYDDVGRCQHPSSDLCIVANYSDAVGEPCTFADMECRVACTVTNLGNMCVQVGAACSGVSIALLPACPVVAEGTPCIISGTNNTGVCNGVDAKCQHTAPPVCNCRRGHRRRSPST
eukprot:m.341185 g.341185  ORF g.341185 m.341185 type:complete len:716 (-) comp19890_c0_seq1:70-2217(-)